MSKIFIYNILSTIIAVIGLGFISTGFYHLGNGQDDGFIFSFLIGIIFIVFSSVLTTDTNVALLKEKVEEIETKIGGK